MSAAASLVQWSSLWSAVRVVSSTLLMMVWVTSSVESVCRFFRLILFVLLASVPLFRLNFRREAGDTRNGSHCPMHCPPARDHVLSSLVIRSASSVSLSRIVALPAADAASRVNGPTSERGADS